MKQIQGEEKVLKEKLACMDHKVERWLDERLKGGGGSEHDGEDTPPTSPCASSDHSSTGTESLTSNFSSRSFVPTPYDKIEFSPLMGCPKGLHADLDHITQAEEASLLAFLSLQKWTKVGHREECQYGYGYLHGECKVISIDATPNELSSLVNFLSGARNPPGNPNQVIAIRYTPPYQLPAHKDAHVFDGTIHTLCLGSGVALTFHDAEQRYDIEHPRRAMVTTRGYSRDTCTHCILPGETDNLGGEVVKRVIRYALTFRRVLDAHLPPSPIHIE